MTFATEKTLQRYRIIAPHLTDGVPISRIAHIHNLARHTVARWIDRYKHYGLSGLARSKRHDKGKQKIEPELRKLIEGFCLRRPAPSIANIRRKVQEICIANGWHTPSYDVVRSIAQAIPADLRTLAHEGEKPISKLLTSFIGGKQNEQMKSGSATIHL